MHTNAHIALGILIATALDLLFELSTFEFQLIVLSAAIVDLDYLIAPLLKERNHRNLFTHSPLIWIIFLGLALFFGEFLFIAIGGFSHLFLDLLDYGLRVPFSRKVIKIGAKEELNIDTQVGYYRNYYGSKRIISIEILLCISSLFVLVYVVPNMLWMSIFLFTTLGLHVGHYIHMLSKETKNRKKSNDFKALMN